MLDAIKPLLDNGIINEDTQQAIAEAWESRITEAKEQVRAELREEFAQRYQHDKQVMVEALDKMVTESLTAELQEFADEKKQLAEDRVAFKQHMVESASKFNNFMVSKLAEEIKELRTDRKTYESAIAKLEAFTIRALAEEIKEFDKCGEKGKPECPQICDFTTCHYKCDNMKLNAELYDPERMIYKKINKKDIDTSTFSTGFALTEIEYCKKKIKEMYLLNFMYTLGDIITYVKNSYSEDRRDLFDEFFVFKALDQLIPVTENDINSFSDTINDKDNRSEIGRAHV